TGSATSSASSTAGVAGSARPAGPPSGRRASSTGTCWQGSGVTRCGPPSASAPYSGPASVPTRGSGRDTAVASPSSSPSFLPSACSGWLPPPATTSGWCAAAPRGTGRGDASSMLRSSPAPACSSPLLCAMASGGWWGATAPRPGFPSWWPCWRSGSSVFSSRPTPPRRFCACPPSRGRPERGRLALSAGGGLGELLQTANVLHDPLDGLQAALGEPGGAEGDRPHPVVAQDREEGELALDVGHGRLVEEVAGVDPEEPGQRLEVDLGRICPEPLAKLPEVGGR